MTKLSKSQIELKNRILYKYDFEFSLIKEFENQNIEITNHRSLFIKSYI